MHSPLCVKQGFDEYMNVVLDDAEEIHLKRNQRKQLGTKSCASFFIFFKCVSLDRSLILLTLTSMIHRTLIVERR